MAGGQKDFPLWFVPQTIHLQIGLDTEEGTRGGWW